MKEKLICGNVIFVDENAPTIIRITLEREGQMHESYGSERLFLSMEIQTSGLTMREKIFLSGEGGICLSTPHDRSGLHARIHREMCGSCQTPRLAERKRDLDNLPTEKREALTQFIFAGYQAGRVTQGDIIQKLRELYEVKS